MKQYLVGGAVRDGLLGRPVKDRDFVIVGATPDEIRILISRGFRPVGKDFPVYLHPETNEEYALARQERKTGVGYHGFRCDTSETVSLEDDLLRRDLTINAMAQTEDGSIIDPFGGRRDLEAGVLRHVSEAFAEDPLRVLRVARFAARYNFQVAEPTLALMRELSTEHELTTLPAERVWVETYKALSEPHPQRFIEVLRDCGALRILFPEIDRLFGVPQTAVHHPEIDTGVHTLMVLEVAASLSPDPLVRFCALVHDLGKGVTPQHLWPQHLMHEAEGVAEVETLCERLKAPTLFRELGCAVTAFHLHCHRAGELRAGSLLSMFEALRAYGRPQRLEVFTLACEADARGRLGFQDTPYPQRAWVHAAFEASRAVQGKTFVDQGYTGKKVGELVRHARIRAIKRALALDTKKG